MILKEHNLLRLNNKLNCQFGNLLEIATSIRPQFFFKNSISFQKQFGQSFENFNITNAFVKSTSKVAEHPMFIASRNANQQFNFTFRTKLKFFEAFGLQSVEPKAFFGVENTPDGFEKILLTIKDDYLKYYSNQIPNKSAVNCFLRSKFTSLVLKIWENQNLFRQFLKQKRFSELFYSILARMLPELPDSSEIINSREKETARNRIDLIKLFLEDSISVDMKRKSTFLTNKKFGDTTYKLY